MNKKVQNNGYFAGINRGGGSATAPIYSSGYSLSKGVNDNLSKIHSLKNWFHQSRK